MAKVFVLFSYVIQYRRKCKLGWQDVDGCWHDRGGAFASMSDAQTKLDVVRKVPGSAVFEWRINKRPSLASKAIA